MSTPPCSIYLVLPPKIEGGDFAHQLEDVLAAGDVASILLWLADGDEGVWQQVSDMVLPIAHTRKIPVFAGGSAVPKFGDADGVHMEDVPEAVKAACAINVPRRMVGAGAFTSRHDIMLAAESDIDYVMFGSANPAHATQNDAEHILQMTSWWAEIFQIPCIAMSHSKSEAVSLAEAGADFVAAADWLWQAQEGPAKALGTLAAALAEIEAAA